MVENLSGGRKALISKDFKPDTSDAEAALTKLMMVNAATRIDDLRTPPGNQLKKIAGTEDVWQIRIDQQQRVRFRWNGQNALDVEVGDFH